MSLDSDSLNWSVYCTQKLRELSKSRKSFEKTFPPNFSFSSLTASNPTCIPFFRSYRLTEQTINLPRGSFILSHDSTGLSNLAVSRAGYKIFNSVFANDLKVASKTPLVKDELTITACDLPVEYSFWRSVMLIPTEIKARKYGLENKTRCSSIQLSSSTSGFLP